MLPVSGPLTALRRVAPGARGRTFAALLGGQLSAQLLGFLGILLIPSFYSAAAFGQFSLIMASTFILQPLISVRLETALLDVTAGATGSVLRLALRRAAVHAAVLAAVAAVAAAALAGLGRPEAPLPLWLVGTAGAYTLYQLLFSTLLAQEAGGWVAVTRVTQAALFLTLMVSLSRVGGASALALAYLLSFALPVLLLGGRLRAVWRAAPDLTDEQRRQVLGRYVWHATPQSVLSFVSQYVLSFVLARFGLTVLGQFAYAQRLASTAQSTLGETLRQFNAMRYRRITQEGGALHRVVVRDTLKLVPVAAAVLALFLIAQRLPLVAQVFRGQDQYLPAVVLWYASMLLNIPANVAATVLGQQRQILICEVFILLTRGGVAGAGLWVGHADLLVIAFCVISVGINAVFTGYLLLLVRRVDGRVSPATKETI
ncbi:hypothetical protein GCM10010844_30340 [Deinococcus radiotolerans]|uniref:Polysaccharide biosynthesis protein n=2 Tax=Deinococcus radiotolerans TaxID=1309407 RepID=A0ABQ2FLD9_9DEIO|nr:hypothetical protein GCM10010844_30340 [Deinococcus radiotolerans]